MRQPKSQVLSTIVVTSTFPGKNKMAAGKGGAGNETTFTPAIKRTWPLFGQIRYPYLYMYRVSFRGGGRGGGTYRGIHHWNFILAITHMHNCNRLICGLYLETA